MNTAATLGRRLGDRIGAGALAVCVILVLLRFFSPSWIAFRAWSRVPEMFSNGILVRRGVNVSMQVVDPFVQIDDPIHKVVRWRLLMPMLGHYLGLSPAVVLGLSYVGCLVVLVMVIRLGRARGFSWSECAMLSLIVGASGWFFVSTGWLGYYDSWLVLGLLTVAWVRHRWLVWVACVFTPWVDERFVLGFPLALLVRWIRTADPPSTGGLRLWLLRDTSIPAMLVAGYVVLRLSLAGHAGSPTLAEYWGGVDPDVPPWRFAFGAWEGLRIGWILVLTSVWLLAGGRRPLAGVLLAIGVAATTAASLATANDLSRAATTVAAVVPLGWELARTRPWWRRFHVAPILAAAALFLPANHVVSTFTVPINDLWYEMQLLLEPPPPFSAEAYLQDAERAVQQGDVNRAEALATLAARLAPSARAHNVRGVILATEGRWQDALGDFDAAVALDPHMAEAWLNRARAHAALGLVDAARTDAEHARALAPDSPMAADAETLLRSLGGG